VKPARSRFLQFAVLLGIVPAVGASAQVFSQRGFVEGRMLVYPQTAPNDDRRVGADVLVRWEAFVRPAPWLGFAGAFDARADTLGQVDESWRIDWQDRTRLRPTLSIRRASAMLHRGGLMLEVGKQFVRWGKTDILNPTDRFAPRDFMDVVVNDFLGVIGARLTYEREGRTIDVVWVPHFTPSRLPLADRRWSVWPQVIELVPVVDGGVTFPGGSQFGVRWNQVASGFEYSLSFYDGYNHLPLFDASFQPAPPSIEIRTVFPRMRMYGGDAAWPLQWLTVKGEIGYFTSTDPRADQYGEYVIQIERQKGEWFFVGGYAGEFVTRPGGVVSFAPDRGLTRSFLGRASYTIDPNRSVALEGAVRQNGHGLWLEVEYSQAVGQHWRATVAGNLIRGEEDDFFGQFRRNSHVSLTLRYSF
jgi:hypothetical protein